MKRLQILRQVSILLLSVSLSTLSLAQSSARGKISGKVIDAETKMPVDYATVSIYQTGAVQPFNGVSSNEKGNFVINGLPAGEYTVKIDFMGYQTMSLEHVVVSGQLLTNSLGTLSLEGVRRELKAVTITARSPVLVNKIDKLIYNASNDLTSQGGMALDVLRKVPMVSVDVDGNVELQGNANMRFLINGKPSSIFGASPGEALQAIPASQIRSIEVITSPGAKYDLAGTAGLINIILKDSKMQGVNGSISLSAGTRLENGSFNINARKDNFGANAYFSGNDQLHSTALTTYNRQSSNATGDTITRLYQYGSNPFVRSGYQAGISINWNITPKDELTATSSTDHAGNHGAGITALDLQTRLASGNPESELAGERASNNRFTERATDWSLSYKKTFKKQGQELDIVYTSTYGKDVTDAAQVTNYSSAGDPTSGSRSYNPGYDHETDISVDYIQPVAKGFTIQTGVKAVLENIDNKIITDTLLKDGKYISDPGQTYRFVFTRNVYAIYLSTSFALFHNFLNGEAGMRVELTDNHSDLAETPIPWGHLWAPAFLIQHQLDATQSIKFGYSYRVERPDYDDLNPFLNIADPHNITTGNPQLKNEIGHKYELGYNKNFGNGCTLYVGGYYNYNTNDIQLFTTYYPIYVVNGINYYDVSLAQRINIGSQTTYGSTISGSVTVSNKLTIRSDMLLREMINTMTGLANVSGFTYKVNINATYQFTPTLVMEVFGNYTSRRTTFQSARPAFLFYTVAVKKQIPDKKMSFGLTASNLFTRYVHQLTTSYGINFNESNIRQIPLRSFGLTFSYKFGKLDVKKGDKEGEETPPIPSL